MQQRRVTKLVWSSIIMMLSLNYVEPRRRIMGGRSTDAAELRYVVRIENYDEEIKEQLHCCTGSLIKPNWVLSAAHCEICVKLRFMRIRYGDVDAAWNATKTYSAFRKLVKHPGYRADPYRIHQGEKLTEELLRHFIYQNDIALFNVDPIPLPLGKLSGVDFSSIMGKEATIAGYGIMALRPILVDNTLALSQPLQQTTIMVKECERSLVINSYPIMCVTHKCEKGDFGEVVMPGDSGGPLIFDGKIMGVCSYGFHSMHGKYRILKESGFYTAISPYLEWINSVIEEDIDHPVTPVTTPKEPISK